MPEFAKNTIVFRRRRIAKVPDFLGDRPAGVGWEVGGDASASLGNCYYYHRRNRRKFRTFAILDPLSCLYEDYSRCVANPLLDFQATHMAERVPQAPFEETPPRLEPGTRKPVVRVLPAGSPVGAPNFEWKQMDVMRTQNPQQAYFRIPTGRPRALNHHGPMWGTLYFGVAVPRANEYPGELVFREPTGDEMKMNKNKVAIKCLDRRVVDWRLQNGARENPYKEISRMQTLGDNIHVLSCIEALEVECQGRSYLYIIMPYCEESLWDLIPWYQGQVHDEMVVRQRFRNILENIRYLHDRGICHRDLSPDNCLIYQGRIVLTDLAMSFRMPSNGGLTTSLGAHGKPAYLPPEVYEQQLRAIAFEATACDLWSAFVILFNLLTGAILYRKPIPDDLNFRYFVMARGFYGPNRLMAEILMDLDHGDPRANTLLALIPVVNALNPEALRLLDGGLRLAPADRWNRVRAELFDWI